MVVQLLCTELTQTASQKFWAGVQLSSRSMDWLLTDWTVHCKIKNIIRCGSAAIKSVGQNILISTHQTRGAHVLMNRFTLGNCQKLPLQDLVSKSFFLRWKTNQRRENDELPKPRHNRSAQLSWNPEARLVLFQHCIGTVQGPEFPPKRKGNSDGLVF